MELSMKAICFKCVSSAEVFIYGDHSGELYYSPDGIKFYELKQHGFRGSSDKHNISFEDPHHDRKGYLKRNGGTLTWDQKTFKLAGVPDEIDVVPLPTVREVEYLFKLKGEVYIYVSHDKYKFSYESFKMFLGKPAQMKEIPVLNVQRYRDGGTTHIETAQGTLFSPTPFDKKKKPTWGGEQIKQIDSKNFVIEENGDTVKITKK
jgi:hypothetical protein